MPPFLIPLTRLDPQMIQLGLIALIILYFAIRWMPLPQRRKRRVAPNDRVKMSPAAKMAAKNQADVEFLAAVGQPRARYTRVTLVFTAVTGFGVLALLQSWGAALVLAFVVFSFRRGRANGKISSARAGLLGEEVIPMARSVSASLSTGMSITQALNDNLRGGKETPLRRALKRALLDPRGLEEGLRKEESTSSQDIMREFLEILADGSTAARNATSTAETLEKFADISYRRRAAWQLALRSTASARGSRSMLLGIVPLTLVGNIMVSGPDIMLHTTGGNIVIMLVFLMLQIAVFLTNKMISGTVKGL